MSSILDLNKHDAMYESSSTLVDADIYYDLDPPSTIDDDSSVSKSDMSTSANSDLYSTDTTVDQSSKVPNHEAKCGCQSCNNKRLYHRVSLFPLIKRLRNGKHKLLSRQDKVGATECTSQKEA